MKVNEWCLYNELPVQIVAESDKGYLEVKDVEGRSYFVHTYDLYY